MASKWGKWGCVFYLWISTPLLHITSNVFKTLTLKLPKLFLRKLFLRKLLNLSFEVNDNKFGKKTFYYQ